MTVLHLVRKNTQLKASFIQNQILNHINYSPYVIFYENRDNQLDGGFANPLPPSIPVLSIASNQNILGDISYKAFKRLGKASSNSLIQLVQQINPDIIHLHYATDAGIFLPLLKNIDIPKIVSVYGYEVSGFPLIYWGYGKFLLKNRTYKYAHKILAMSPDMEKDLMDTGCPKEKIIVHYYGSEVQRFKADHVYRDNKAINFLIISGLTPQKGHLFLLEAFKNAFEKDKNIQLTIVGDGPEKGKILDFINENRMGNHVDVRPFVIYGSEEHKKYLFEADVFIHPSVTDTNGDKEGIPGAVVEAMAAGLPIISTFHAGIPYVVENNMSGLLVKEWDVDALTQAIRTIADDANLRVRLGTAAQLYAIANLDLMMLEKNLEHIYKQLI